MKKIKVSIYLFLLLIAAMILVSCSSNKIDSIYGKLGGNSNKVTVIFLIEGNASIIPSKTVDADTVIQLPDAEIEDNKILGWSEISPYDPVPMNVGSDYTVRYTVILYAVMEIDNTAVVIFDVEGDIGLVPPKYVLKNTSIILPNATVTNHTLKGWSETGPEDNNPLLIGSSYYVTEQITLYAVLEKKPPPYETVTVQFSVEGKIDNSLTCEVDAGTSIELPNIEPSSPDLMFAGWSGNPDGGGLVRPHSTNYIANKDATLYAKFMPAASVIFSINGDTSILPPEIVAPNTVIILPETTVDGEPVIGWIDTKSEDPVLLEPGSEYTVTESTVLEAVFDTKIIVTFDVHHGGIDYNEENSVIEQIIAIKGKQIELPDFNDNIEGYTFIGWTLDENYSEINNVFPAGSLCAFNEDTTLYAEFREMPTVTFSVFLNGTEYNEYGDFVKPMQVDFGKPALLPGLDISVDGYSFVGWKLNPEESKILPAGSLYAFYEDTTLYAVFVVDPTVTFSIYYSGEEHNADGAVIAPKQVKAGERIELPDIGAVPQSYHFQGWSENADGSNPMFSGSYYTVNSDVTLHAVFIEQVTVTFNAWNYDFRSDTLGKGGSIILPVYSESGYRFAGWSEIGPDDQSPMEAGTRYYVDSDIRLYAVLIEQVTVTYDVHGSLTYKTVDKNSPVILPGLSTDVPSFRFVGWSEPDSDTVWAAGDTYTARTDITLYAILIQQVTVTYNVQGSNVSSETVNIGGKVILPDAIVANYDMLGWTESPDRIGFVWIVGAEYEVNGNITLYAKISRTKVTVSFSVDGSLNSSLSETVNINTNITLPNPAVNGYNLLGWTINSDGTGNILEAGSIYNAKENIILYAKLEAFDDVYTFRYLVNNAYEITAYSGKAAFITIPSEYNGGTVVHIGPNIFMNNTSIISVSLPSSVNTIGIGAFYGASNLTVINLNFVINIGANAFNGASALRISALNSIGDLKTIGTSAFANASIEAADYTDTFVLKSSITSIGVNAFYGWTEDMTIDITYVSGNLTQYTPGWSGGQVYLLDNNV